MSLTHTRTETFEVTGELTLAAELRAADLVVTAVPGLASARLDIHVAGTRAEELAHAVVVTAGAGRIDLEVPSTVRFLGVGASVRIQAEVPEGTSLQVGSGSGDIDAVGRFAVVDAHAGSGDVRVGSVGTAALATGSGDIRLAGAENAVLRAGSGDVEVGDVAALRVKVGSGDLTATSVRSSCVVRTGSGDVTIGGLTGAAQVEAGSGSLRLGAVDGSVKARSGSGEITIDRLTAGHVELTTSSGSQRIAVPAGTALRVDADSRSGRVSSELGAVADGTGFERTAEVVARASSGSITFRRAA